MSVLPLREAKDSLVKASTPEPFSTSRTSNWVARGGGLPDYIQHIAHDLVEKRGKSESNAIQMAIGIVKRWARGGGNVDATTRAAAAKAVAEWEALKAKNAGKSAAKAVVQHSAGEPSIADELALREMALTRVALLEEAFGGADGLICLLERDVLQEAAASFPHKLVRTAAADTELERHEVEHEGQMVGMISRRKSYDGKTDMWSARGMNGAAVSERVPTKGAALEALRKHLEDAPARVINLPAANKYLVARPSTYGQTTYTEFPSESAARHAAGLPAQPTLPERSAQVDSLGEMLWMDLATLSGQDIPPLRRVQEARRRVPLALAEAFHPGELRGFHGRWTKGGSHTPSLAALIEPARSPSVPSRPARALAAKVTPSGPTLARPHSPAFQRYEGGVGRFVSGETRARMLGMFTDAEKARDKPRQPASGLDELYAHVPGAQKRLEGVLRRVAARMNADERNFHEVDREGPSRLAEGLTHRSHQVHIILGPTKSLKRAREKVDAKYAGDAGRLTDVTRATIAVPHADDLPGAMEALRKALPSGWEVRKPENRYVFVAGDKTHTGDQGGYRDVSLLLVDPTGFVHEIQLNTTHMTVAKNGRGHDIYEQLQNLQRTAAGRPDGRYTRQEAQLRRSLEHEARQMYGSAMVRSTSPAARLAPRSPLR